ncbi:hypothetical protein M9H77_22630 [Catharanthus roseus]|uniref:Uncharacterized protein n=1 Tax=Catharanthus roseus TaxID=4058 RepID=A0ACC0AS82_CATRO|nr:hypothetical protein M9H77_22630 [Catharanthus roseus]
MDSSSLLSYNNPNFSSSRNYDKDQTKKVKNVGKKSVKLSTDAQSVAARERRHRISERFKILQSLVPGGNKMDTVSMLEEAIHYVKFLKTQIWLHQTIINSSSSVHPNLMAFPNGIYNQTPHDYDSMVPDDDQMGLFLHSSATNSSNLSYEEINMGMAPFDAKMPY